MVPKRIPSFLWKLYLCHTYGWGMGRRTGAELRPWIRSAEKGRGRRCENWNTTTIWLGEMRGRWGRWIETSLWEMKQNNSNLVGASTDFCADVCNYGYIPLSHLGNIVLRIKTQQQQSGWAMEGCTTPRSAAMDTFRWDAGRGRRYEKWNKTTIIWLGQVRTSVPGVCNYGYVPLSHLGNIVIRIKTTTSGWVEFEICRIVNINCNYITKDRQVI